MKLKKINKKAIEMSFAWIFAIIAGIAILFIAIYVTTQFIKTRKYEIDIQTANKIAILIDPLETSLEAGKSSVIIFSSETRIYNDKCYTNGNFGEQRIGISEKSGVGEQWPKPAYGKPIYNKYIFSNSIEEEKEFSVFLMPFNIPFKVSDLIIFSGENYCFIQSPNEIKDELEGLGIKNLYFTDKKSNCSQESKTVCFPTSGSISGCKINVYGNDYEFSSGFVSKEGQSLYYTGPLIYGAIFSSPVVYECNVKRLMLRFSNLCLVYKDEIKILEKRGCSSLLDSHLSEMINLAQNLNSSQSLLLVQEKANEIDRLNEAAVCKVY